jgi:hypothetical protein
MQKSNRIILLAGLMSTAGLAQADVVNGPDPYAAGYGFDLPNEAAWGGWNRGDAGTLYAEWDNFSDASYGSGSDRTAAPTAGSSGTSDAYLSWNAGTFSAGSGNLYSFSVAESFQAHLIGSTGPGPLRIALQTEEWGTPIDTASVLLNGTAPTFSSVTYSEPAYPSSFGEVALTQRLFYWDLASAPASFLLAFSSAESSLSLAQVAVDVGPVAAVPVPAAIWLMGSALAGMGMVGRRGRGGRRELLA